MKQFFFAFIFCILCVKSAAASQFEIAALVNDDTITTRQLDERLQVITSSSGLPNNAEVRKRFTPRVLQMLIDESLQREEAKKNNISISEDEIHRAFGEIEKQNRLQPGQFPAFIRSKGLSSEAVQEQIRAQLLWNKFVLRKIRPQIVVTDTEVNDLRDRMTRAKGEQVTEVRIGEIVLNVTDEKQAEEVSATAQKLSMELQNGADFEAIARQFSESSTAKEGGNLGWLGEGDLATNLRDALASQSPGSVTAPIRTDQGYSIVKLYERRTQAGNSSAPDTNKIKDMLTLQKLELEARRYLANLRQKAYIEKRISS